VEEASHSRTNEFAFPFHRVNVHKRILWKSAAIRCGSSDFSRLSSNWYTSSPAVGFNPVRPKRSVSEVEGWTAPYTQISGITISFWN
jgi:hypothetical protein